MGLLPPKMQEKVHVNLLSRKGVATATIFRYLLAEDVGDLLMFRAMFRSAYAAAWHLQSYINMRRILKFSRRMEGKLPQTWKCGC